MIKSKKAQQIFVSMMVSIMVLILVVIMSPVLKEEITKSVNGSYSGNLSTANTAISVPNRAALITLDLMLFYFIGILIASSIAYVSGRKSFVGVITAIMVFIVVSVLITPLKVLIVIARDSSHLNCASAATVGQSLSCIIVDIWLFYFVITVIAAAATFIFVTKVIKK